MAGFYRRATAPNFTSPAMQVAASRGAGGAIPGGGVSVPRGQQGSGMDMGQLGGLLGLLQKMKDKQDPTAAAEGVHADAGAMANTLPSPAQAGTLGNGIPAATPSSPAVQVPGGGIGMDPANMPLSGGGIGNAVDSGMGAGMNGIPGTGGMPGGASTVQIQGGGIGVNPMNMPADMMLQNFRLFG